MHPQKPLSPPIHQTRTACMNPCMPETPPLLEAYKPLLPDGQQHVPQLTTEEVVSVVDTDWCVAVKSLVADFAHHLQKTWVYHNPALRSSGELCAKAGATSRETCLAKLYMAGLSALFTIFWALIN